MILGFIISITIHISILMMLYYLSFNTKPKKKVKEKTIYVYIENTKNIAKETKLTKKVTPEGIPDKKVENKKEVKPKPKEIKKEKPIKKKVVKKVKKKVVKKTKSYIKPIKKVVKEKKKEKVIVKKKAEEKKKLEEEKREEKANDTKENEKNISETPSSQINEESEKNNENTPENKSLTLASLKGKDKIFDIGKDKEQEKKEINDDDIKKYLEALNRYLNTLSRRKDLYPPMAKRLRLEGSLIVKFKIRADGSVDENSIEIVISSGYNVLDEGAKRIIKEYVPLFAKKYGKKPPKDIVVKLPVTFQIIGW
jgi:protein TonB